MDFIIVSTGTEQQKRFWEAHFDRLQSAFLKPSIHLIVTCEDWRVGAGNGLGSLYAYQQARQSIKNRLGIDLLEEQKRGAAILIYHTAGKGMRLYPLAGSAQNNKSSVKLPAYIDSHTPLTILDGAIKQSVELIPSFSGRMAVFWSDQVFILSRAVPKNMEHHVEIFMQSKAFPSRSEWITHSLDRYGWITCNRRRDAKLIDKCGFDVLKDFIQKEKAEEEGNLGLSLGCFNCSYEMTMALIDFFQEELQQKKDKMDSDPFFWMPCLLNREMYISLMMQKKYSYEFAEAHFFRMQEFKKQFVTKYGKNDFFGAIDIGEDSFWWDYGTIKDYFINNMKLVGQGLESQVMRQFFNMSQSCILNCNIGSGRIKNSVLINVKAEHLDVEDCLIIHSSLKTLKARHCLLYEVQEASPLIFDAGTVRSDVLSKNRHFKMYSNLDRDGKEDWEVRLPGNEISYRELCERD